MGFLGESKLWADYYHQELASLKWDYRKGEQVLYWLIFTIFTTLKPDNYLFFFIPYQA
jgi:hypothetical protein